MASNSETGHVVNINNFKLMNDTCVGYGASYDPSNVQLGIANLTAVWTTADGAQQVLTTAISNAKLPINERVELFGPVNKLVTRLLNYYESTAASKSSKADAKGLADRYRGHKVQGGSWLMVRLIRMMFRTATWVMCRRLIRLSC